MSQPPKASGRSTSQLVSQIVSAAGFGLMIAGFLILLLQHGIGSFPGDSAVPLGRLTHLSDVPAALLVVSMGIVTLALLPMIRVLLKLLSAVRERNGLTALVAIVVLAELLLSMRSS